MLFFAGLAGNYTSPGAYPYDVLDASDWFVLVDTTSTRTINLPDAATAGRIFVIKAATKVCRMHGARGGPKTQQGKAKSQMPRLKHGFYSVFEREERSFEGGIKSS